MIKRLILLAIISLAFPVQAATVSNPVVSFLRQTADTIVVRVSDIVYYLVMQKRYIFNGFSDPNVYTVWQLPVSVDEAITGLVSSTTSVKPVNSAKVIVPDTTTVPVVQTPHYTSTNDSEILNYTNQERQSLSAETLIPNTTLDAVASSRADDLFTNQYFEHESPDHQSAPDLAKKFDYNYSLIGENLALGNFENEKAIVEAWMKSPGHRANILNPEYRELGVSVKEGIFKGESVTIAVQIFAKPTNNCSAPKIETKNLIDTSSVSIKEMQAQAKLMYDSLEGIKNASGLDLSYYNQKVQEYNYFAKKINETVSALKVLVDSYNAQVAQYNSCIK